MPSLRWVCLSDTHFGAENSVLSHIPEGSSHVDPSTASGVLAALMACLRTVVDLSPGPDRPHLVLNGDIVELALAPDNIAAMVFDRFVDLAYADGPPLFDDTITYIPGNHDHHMWETARERQYATYVSSVPRDGELLPPWHVTTLFGGGRRGLPDAELMTALVRRRSGPQVNVQVAYPNFGVVAEDSTRAVLFHHGHFVEPLYTLMSAAKADLFPSQPPGAEIWDWEADNFAWIDFFWSSLGRSGEAGEDVGLIYDMLQDSRALDQLAENLAAASTARTPPLIRPVAREAADVVLKHIAHHIENRERANPHAVLSESARAGLARYLTGPLRRQVQRERPDVLGAPVSFVFGHTHKPFEDRDSFAPWAQPVTLYNTGGWVVDTEAPSPVQGAAVVLIDDACNVASLRFYNQSGDSDDYRVALAAPLSDPPNALHAELEGQLDFSQPPWSSFSAQVERAVAQRHQLLPVIIERGMALTRPRPPG